LIEIRDLRKVYRSDRRDVVALDGVSLEIAEGEIVGILGESGAGKSTLIRCINQLERPTSGEVIVNGKNLTRLDGAELRAARREIGMIFQHFNLLSSRTVAQNVALALEVAGYERSKRRGRVMELLELVGLEDKADVYPSRLSGGQKQRVGIARALAPSPSLLLSDEATSSLDPATTQSILNLLRDLNRELNLTILLITHEVEVVKQICQRVAMIERGKLVETGPVAQLASTPGSRLNRTLFPETIAVTPAFGFQRVVLTFGGAASEETLLASLIRDYELDLNLAGGVLEEIGGERVGQLHLDLRGPKLDAALAHLRSLPVSVGGPPA
jgi:D-methionine transport system ATP-binding protein